MRSLALVLVALLVSVAVAFVPVALPTGRSRLVSARVTMLDFNKILNTKSSTVSKNKGQPPGVVTKPLIKGGKLSKLDIAAKTTSSVSKPSFGLPKSTPNPAQAASKVANTANKAAGGLFKSTPSPSTAASKAASPVSNLFKGTPKAPSKTPGLGSSNAIPKPVLSNARTPSKATPAKPTFQLPAGKPAGPTVARGPFLATTYVPDGFTKESYAQFKAEEAAKKANKAARAPAQSFDDWLEAGGQDKNGKIKHRFPKFKYDGWFKN